MNSINEIDALMRDIAERMLNCENVPADQRDLHKAHYDFLKKKKGELGKSYKLVFIGEKAAGKTTTILQWFGLSKKINGKDVDLLETGSGGTTTCEVELVKSNKAVTYFEIEPIDGELFDQYIDDFCLIYDDDDKKDIDKDAYLPTEINRSIRNMIGLKKKDIEALRKECKDSSEFKDKILKKINIQKRNKTTIECQSIDGSFFKSCQAKFNEINLCKIDTVMLPKRINIFLTKDVLDFSANGFISSIVDTRGIDTTVSSDSDSKKDSMKREDILNHIDKDQDNCLFFFIDDFTRAPSQNISELLRTRLATGNEFRFYLIANIRGKEAEEVVTDDGKAGTMEAGINYKKEDAIEKFKHSHIPFSEDNLFFYNARENNPDNKSILSNIERNISKHEQEVYRLCDDIQKAYDKNHYALPNFEQLQKCVKNTHAPDDIFSIVISSFIKKLENVHHARLNAMNRRKGEYYAFDFFHEMSIIVERIFDGCFFKKKEEVIKKIHEFINSKDFTELDKIHYRVFLEKFEDDYNTDRVALKESVTSEIETCFRDQAWEAACAEFGQGKGFKDRVLDIYRNELMFCVSEIHISDRYNSTWHKLLEKNSLS